MSSLAPGQVSREEEETVVGEEQLQVSWLKQANSNQKEQHAPRQRLKRCVLYIMLPVIVVSRILIWPCKRNNTYEYMKYRSI